MPINTLNPRIHLASRSPRRRELLKQIGVPFDTMLLREPPRVDYDVDETPLAGEEAVAYVERVARAKALHGWRLVAWRRLQPQPVLAADTTVEFNGTIVGKPDDVADAEAILTALSGQAHRVLTAVAVAVDDRVETALSISEVRFAQIAPKDIVRYVASGEPMDKAGAYAIQGRAAVFVEHIAGSYSGVMGLPLYETVQLLKRFNYPF